MATVERTYSEHDLSSLLFWQGNADDREVTFARLRAESPVSWHPPAEGGLMPPAQDGYWAVVTHADIRTVSRSHETYTSSDGVMLEDVPGEILDAAQSFLAMDAPRHTRLRRLVSSAFTPRQVARIEEQIRGQSDTIVTDLLEVGGGDFVELVAQRLPAWTISEMMGVDEADRDAFVENANAMVGWNDPVLQAGRDPVAVLFDALLALQGLASTMTEDRRSTPRDDLMTSLVQAEVDGERLTDAEIAAFFVLLAVAGNDTTRNTISHGMKALCDYPEQRAILTADLETHLPTAVEEMVRWASPVMTFRRNVAHDTELHGQTIAAGERVVLFYASGNRDAAVFDQPNRFDVTRSPNDHVGFGGGGPHFCLGAALARTQLRSIFADLLTRAPRLRVGEPERLVGNFINGIRALPCTTEA